MTEKTTMNTPNMADEEFLARVFTKSESVRSVNAVRTALNIFDQLCQHEIGLNGSLKGR